MIQYPKTCGLTLGSVESWSTNMNIVKDPPKAVYTRRKDKVFDTQKITNMVGESHDRISECIKVYPRGINPHVAVSYSNYGTNGGQNRQTTLSGVMGKNKSCADGRSALTGQASLPYKVNVNGAFRPPLIRQEDLLPLSRLPRTNTSAYSHKALICYNTKPKCPVPEKIRHIKDPIRTNIRPTATLNNAPSKLIEPFEIRQVIDNPIHIAASSGFSAKDITQKTNSDVSGIIQDTLDGNIRTNNSKSYLGSRSVKDLNPENFITDITYSNVTINKGKNMVHLLEQSKGDLPVKSDMINISATAGINIPNAEPLKNNINYELQKSIPRHQYVANKSSNIYKKSNYEQKKKDLDRNRPIAAAQANTGFGYGADMYSITNRSKSIKDTLRPTSGIEGKATIPKIQIERKTQFTSGQNKMDILRKSNRTMGTR